MKKILLGFGVVVLLIGLAGCAVTSEKKELTLKPSVVKTRIKGWGTHTNPAYRYELRYPQGWELRSSGEDGKEVRLFLPSGDIALKILSYSNWQQRYSLEQFYQNQPVNFFQAKYDKESVTLDPTNGFWFKKVNDDGRTIDLIALDLTDRIVEIRVYADWETSQTVINSLNFYDNRTLSELK